MGNMDNLMADIRHHPDEHCFTLKLGDAEARLEYQLLADQGVDFIRTYVPNEFRGKGLAEKLVRRGLSWAHQQGYSVSASCWYVEKFLR